MIKALIEALEKQARDQGLSRTQLAARLGISENYLYHIKTGRRHAGHRLLIAIRREFPSLQSNIWEYEQSLILASVPKQAV